MRIKISPALLILLFSIISLPISAQENTGNSLWTRAVEYFAANEGLRPGTMHVQSKTFDRKDKLEKDETQYYMLSYDLEGQPETELIKAIENGVDITEKKKEEIEVSGASRNRRSGGDGEEFNKSPLDPDFQNSITAIDSGNKEYRNGQLCSVWAFEFLLNDKYTAVGKAWLNPANGAAVSLEYTLTPEYPFTENVIIRIDYTLEESGKWYADKFIFRGTMNLIVMKKRFDTTSTFSDYTGDQSP